MKIPPNIALIPSLAFFLVAFGAPALVLRFNKRKKKLPAVLTGLLAVVVTGWATFSATTGISPMPSWISFGLLPFTLALLTLGLASRMPPSDKEKT